MEEKLREELERIFSKYGSMGPLLYPEPMEGEAYRTGRNEKYSCSIYKDHIDVHEWDTLEIVETIKLNE